MGGELQTYRVVEERSPEDNDYYTPRLFKSIVLVGQFTISMLMYISDEPFTLHNPEKNVVELINNEWTERADMYTEFYSLRQAP